MGRNNKSIHLLRGNKNSHPSEVLDSGQPFYDKYGRSIYIGDGDTSLSALMPISGGWDKLAYEESQSDLILYISESTLINKIKSAGFLRCTSSNGGTVGLGGLFVDGSSNPDYAYIEDKWNLIYVVDPSNHNLGGILAIGDTKGVFYGKITSTTSIEWVRLTAPNSLSYTYLDSSNKQTATSLMLGKDSLVPSSSSSVNLGSNSNRFNTIYTDRYFLPGQRFDFQYDHDNIPTINAKLGFSCINPSGGKVTIPRFEFYDGNLTHNSSSVEYEEHLTWIKAKGLVPHMNNEINIDLNLGSSSNSIIHFGYRDSTDEILGYNFWNGKGNDGHLADIGCNNINAHEIKSDAVIYNGSGNIDNTKCHYFIVPDGKAQSFGTISLPPNTKGAISSSGGDCCLWYVTMANADSVAGFLAYNSGSNGGWYKSAIEAPYFNATSDKRLKENIIPFTSEKSILDLPIYTFNFKSDKNKKKHVGCLAQDLQEICPDLVNEDSQGYLSIEESKITYLLLEEVKELKKRVKELEEKISNEEKVSNNSNNLSSSSDVLGDR